MLPPTMRAYRWDSFGGLDGLNRVELPLPTPGRGEALLRLHASALNYRDLIVLSGSAPGGVQPGHIPLCDGAGEIVALGDACGRLNIGDRVSPNIIRHWVYGQDQPRDIPPAMNSDGMLAEYAVVPESCLVRIPDHLSWHEAATFPCAAITAWSALFETHAIKPGQSVLIQGTGGVSLFAVQFARAAGARVVAITSSESKERMLRQLGADVTINYSHHHNWDEHVLAATDGKGVDLVVEVGGAATLERSFRSTRTDGRISIVGMAASADGPQLIDPTHIRWRRLKVHSFWCGSRETFEEMHAAVRVNGIRPVIDKVFPFEQAIEAYEYFIGRRHVGKVAISHGR
jgi:alcohol dehydrogenase